MKESKRNLVKTLVTASVWSTPVVGSVVLPVHGAATTFPCDAGTCGADIPDGDVGFGMVVRDGMVSFEGSDAGCSNPGWEGSGPVNADGTFNVEVARTGGTPCTRIISGTIASNCINVVGGITPSENNTSPFTAILDPQFTEFSDCN